MRQQSLALALLWPVGILAIVGPTYANDMGKKSKTEVAAAAKVTIEQAIKAASDKVAGTVIEAELEKKHNKLLWEVEVVTAESKVMEVYIDADSGAVIDVEEEKEKPKKTRKQKD